MTGAYALVALSTTRSATKSSPPASARPIVVGLGRKRIFRRQRHSGDPAHTRSVFFLGDGEIAVVTPQGVRLIDFESHPINRPAQHITWDPIMAEKGGFKHFMQKEIFEQPRAVRDTLLGRISQETGKVFLDRDGHHRGGIPQFPRREDRRLRHQLARRACRKIHDRAAGAHSGRSRLRQRIPLSRSHRRQGQPDHRHQPVRRNRRHARGRNAKRAARARKFSPSATWSARCSRAKRTARSTRTPARKSASPRPKRSPASSPRCCSPRSISRRSAASSRPRQSQDADAGADAHPAQDRNHSAARRRASKSWRGNFSATPIFSTSAAESTTPSRSKAR